MYKGISYTHFISVTIFLVIYLVKTILLLGNKQESLAKFTKSVKVPEMIVSFLFLATGIYLLLNIDVINTLLIVKIVAVFASIPLAVIGFRKQNKALAVVSFLLILASFALAEISHKKRVNPAAAAPVENQTAGTPADGHDIYVANCTRCHGDDGKLGLTGATDLSATTLDINAQLEVVKNGRNGTMPAFAGVLNDEEIGAVVGYVETLKK